MEERVNTQERLDSKMLKGVIFDMDGVIINSEPQHYEAYVMLCKDYGVELPYEIYKGFIGGTHATVCEYLKKDLGIPLPEEEMQEILRKNRQYLIDTKGYEEIPGIRELIQSLHSHGIRLAIASSSPEKEIQAVVESLGIEKYFEKLVSGETVEHPKPAPDVFLKAVKALDLSVDECIIIEDSGNGVKASVAAGVPVIGFYNPDSGNQDLSKANIVVEGFEEIDFDFVEKVYQRAYKIP